MRQIDRNIEAFFALVQAGLWEKEVRLLPFGDIDFDKVYRLSSEQSVVGLVAAGLEHVSDMKLPKATVVPFMGAVLQMEQRNTAMNSFLVWLLDELRKKDVYALLVKGPGVGQCYERPLWRSCGDVDLLLDKDNYEKAKGVLIPIASDVKTEYTGFLHLGMTIQGWMVELHGTLHTRLSEKVDRDLDDVQRDCFNHESVRVWENGTIPVFLPAVNQDILFVFTHILHHFFLEGVGLRQICDWCRLMWTFRDSIDNNYLESHLKTMGLMSEWKAFAAYAVGWLGMPREALPFYSSVSHWHKKAERINDFVLKVGNFGHNQKRLASDTHPYWLRKLLSLLDRFATLFRTFRIFPMDTIRFFFGVLKSGVRAVVRGE